MTSLTVHVGDVANGCPEVADESVDFSFTSPPYFLGDGYSDALMVALGRIWARVMKQGGRAYMNFGQIQEKFDRPLDAQRAIIQGAGGQLIAGQEIIWVKSIAVGGWKEKTHCPGCAAKIEIPVETLSRGHYQPITSKDIMHYCWEHVFSFIKLPTKKLLPLKRTAIGVPFTDKSNMKRGKRGKNGDLHCAGDIWFIPHETAGPTVKKDHKHEFPIELPRRAIKVSGIPSNSLVFDPFAGSGTTAFAARELGMRSVCYDKDEMTANKLRSDWEGATEVEGGQR
jgi:site-specific DNA-methyltransferase (adenine-specific)